MTKTDRSYLYIFTAVCFSVLCSCANGSASTETANMSLAYGATATISLLTTFFYISFVRQKHLWMLSLFLSVFVVNVGYLALSISKTLEEALLANRISYLGSVFLPLCMLVCIMDICGIKYRKWVLMMLFTVSFMVFLLAASPGYLNLYYNDVSIVFINGMAKLNKVYGPYHFVYMLYLLVFFAIMIAVVPYSLKRKKSIPVTYALLILTIVFFNIAIWFVEQRVYSDFEFLSVSYIASELLLLMLQNLVSAQPSGAGAAVPDTLPPPDQVSDPPQPAEPPPSAEADRSPFGDIETIKRTCPSVSLLTARETDVFMALLEDKRRKDIAAEMHVTEHTVKKHTANIFSKLEVSSRSELFEKLRQKPE